MDSRSQSSDRPVPCYRGTLYLWLVNRGLDFFDHSANDLANCILLDGHFTGAPNDRFLSNAFKRCFRLSGVLLKLCRLILCCVKKV